MKETELEYTSLLEDRPRSSRRWIIMFAVSTLGHFLLFAFFLLSPSPSSNRRIPPAAIDVSLVSLPENVKSAKPKVSAPLKSKTPTAESKTVKKVLTKKNVVAVKTPSEVISLAPKTASEKMKTKTSLKEKTFKSLKVVKNPFATAEKVEKKVEKKETNSLEKALARIKDKVEKAETLDRLRDSVEQREAQTEIGFGKGTGDGNGRPTSEVKDLYRVEIAYKIQKNWAFSDQLAGQGKMLRASLVFKVMPNGEITDVFFVDRSGNTYLDDSAYRAILKSNPVDPHPSGISEPFVEVGLNFTPEGVR